MTLNYETYGLLRSMGNAGFISSTVAAVELNPEPRTPEELVRGKGKKWSEWEMHQIERLRHPCFKPFTLCKFRVSGFLRVWVFVFGGGLREVSGVRLSGIEVRGSRGFWAQVLLNSALKRFEVLRFRVLVAFRFSQGLRLTLHKPYPRDLRTHIGFL